MKWIAGIYWKNAKFGIVCRPFGKWQRFRVERPMLGGSIIVGPFRFYIE